MASSVSGVMRNYQLLSKSGWNSFTENRSLASVIYSTFMPLVNEGKYNYMNFTSESGMFEDELGNSVFLEFDENGEEIRSLRVSFMQKEGSNLSFLEKATIDLESKYDLVKIQL